MRVVPRITGENLDSRLTPMPCKMKLSTVKKNIIIKKCSVISHYQEDAPWFWFLITPAISNSCIQEQYSAGFKTW